MKITSLLALLFSVSVMARVYAADVPAKPGVYPFFPFCIDTHDEKKRSLEEQAQMLKELGYEGVGHLWLDNVAERLKTLDAHGLKLFQITIRVDLTPGKEPFDPRFKATMPLLKGRHVQIDTIIAGMKPFDPAGREKAVQIVRDLADMAKDSGTEILVYPHTNDWMQRIEDAVAVAKEVNRPNVGVMFNLCHYLKVDGKQDVRELLKQAMPYLRAVSIHGADTAESIHAGTGNWIQPLGQGTYDVLGLLKTLQELGYKGPVGLQCWGITGDTKVHLEQSIKAWHAMEPQLAAK